VLLSSHSLPAYDEEEAMTVQDILEELKTGNYDEWFGQESTDINTSSVKKALKEMCKKPPHRAAVLEENDLIGKAKAFFVNEEGLDMLPGYAASPLSDDEPSTGAIDGCYRSMDPALASRQSSASSWISSSTNRELQEASEKASYLGLQAFADAGFDKTLLMQDGAGPPAPFDTDSRATKRPKNSLDSMDAMTASVLIGDEGGLMGQLVQNEQDHHMAKAMEQ